MSQRERTEAHKSANPADEARRKERQRQKDTVLRFHIRRRAISSIHLPDSIDQTSKAFKRVLSDYMKEAEQPVEIEEIS